MPYQGNIYVYSPKRWFCLPERSSAAGLQEETGGIGVGREQPKVGSLTIQGSRFKAQGLQEQRVCLSKQKKAAKLRP